MVGRHMDAAKQPTVHRAAWRPDQHRRPARRHLMGRDGHRARLRAPTPPRPSAHRAHLDGRSRRTGPRPTEDRRPRMLTTTQRYLHPDRREFEAAATALSAHLTVERSPSGPYLRAV